MKKILAFFGKWSFALTVFIATAFFLVGHLPAALWEGYDGYHWLDTRFEIQAGERYVNDGRFETNTFRLIDNDLSKVGYGYPVFWAPGGPAIIAFGRMLGLSGPFTYKLAYLGFGIIGIIAWLALAKNRIPASMLLVYGIIISLCYATPFHKLVHLVFWCLTPFYVMMWLRYLGTPAQDRTLKMLLGIPFLVFAYPWIYTGGKVEALAIGIVTFVLIGGSFSSRCWRTLLLTWPALAGHFSVSAWIYGQPELIHLDYPTGFFPFLVPWEHYLPTLSLLFGDFFGLTSALLPLQRLAQALGTQRAFFIFQLLVSLAGAACMVTIARTGLKEGKWLPWVRSLATISFVSCAVYFFVNVYLDVIWCKTPDWSFSAVVQIRRVANHLLPAIGLVWIALLCSQGRANLSRLRENYWFRHGVRVGIAVLLLSWFASFGFICAKALTGQGFSSSLHRYIKARFKEKYSHEGSLTRSLYQRVDVSRWISEDLQTRKMPAHTILTHDTFNFGGHPKLNCAKMVDFDTSIDQLRNTKRIYIYYVKQLESEESDSLIDLLGLAEVRKLPLNVTLYAGWVEPFEAGSL